MQDSTGAGVMRTVAVTGATGFVGRHVVAHLLRGGFGVRALVRDRAKASELLGEAGGVNGVEAGRLPELVVGDVFDRSSVESLCRGADALVHTIGIRRELPPNIRFERLHVTAVERVLAGCAAGGVKRLLHVSAFGVRANASSGYARTKYEGELLVRRSGLSWTIFRPSVIHGSDGEFMQLVKGWIRGSEPPYVVIPYFTRVKDIAGFPPRPGFESAVVAPVLIEDVASAVVRSLDCSDSIGEVYALVGPEELRWPELLSAVRSRLPMASRRKPIVGLPGHVGVAMALSAKVVGLGPLLPFGPSEPMLAMEDSVANVSKASAHLGFSPRGFVESMSEYVEAL